jgi:hypothetical protein
MTTFTQDGGLTPSKEKFHKNFAEINGNGGFCKVNWDRSDILKVEQ